MPTTVERDIAASRRLVWDVLADGWTYPQWVVGNSRIRAVDDDWPAPGTRILRSAGMWPLVAMTLVPNRLQLAGIWPRNREGTWRLAGLAEHREPADVQRPDIAAIPLR